MSVATVYRGHKIQWSDNSDEWTCYDLSDRVRSSPKLSLIKAAIDRLYLAERKENATPCFEITRNDGSRVESSVVEYLGERYERAYGKTPEKIKHRVAVVAKRTGSERPSRRETELAALAPASPDTETAWANFKALYDAAREADRTATAAFAAIPRLQPKDISALIKLHSEEPS